MTTRTEEMMGFAYRSALSRPNRQIMVVAATPKRVNYCLEMIDRKVERDYGGSMLFDGKISLPNASVIYGMSLTQVDPETSPSLDLIVWDEIEDCPFRQVDTGLTSLLPLLSEREGTLVTSMDHSGEFFAKVFAAVVQDGAQEMKAA